MTGNPARNDDNKSMEAKLSKSQYVQGLQCPKRLWLYRNRKDLIPPADAARQARFDMGNEIGELAQQYFDGGIEVTNEYFDVSGGIKATEQFVADGQSIIFEATALNAIDGSYARIDILRKVEDTDEWDLIEVKSSTGVKDYHLHDMSFQFHVFYGAGYKIRRCFMMVLDNTYVRDGDIDPQKLFKLEDITEQVHGLQATAEYMAGQLGYVLDLKQEPEADIGTRCNDPFECPFKQYCWHEQRNVPEYSLYDIYSKTNADEMVAYFKSHDVLSISEDMMPNGVKAIDVKCYQDDVLEYVEPEKLRGFTERVQYPAYYLDYESIMSAIPPFDGTRPYQQIVFQFSCHIQHEEGGALEHIEFLHTDASDPREAFANALIEACGDDGSIIVYNQTFEASRNRELGEQFSHLAEALAAINDRMVNLLEPFKKRWLYSPAQKSSASIKAVLPAFAPDLSYKDLNIGDGGQAMQAYESFLSGNVPEAEQDALWADLRKYCELDTYAMVVLLDVIRKKMDA